MLGIINSSTKIVLRRIQFGFGHHNIIIYRGSLVENNTATNKRFSTKFTHYQPKIMTPSPLTPDNPSSSKSRTQKPFLLTISVDGNISSGKSTLVSTLSDIFPKDFNYEVQIVPEPLEKWTNLQGHNLLGLLYEDTQKNNFLFQHYVQLTRLMDTIKTAKQQPRVIDGFSGRIRILERSLQNNRYCFSELAKRQGTLHEAEFSVLAEWYKWLEQHVDLTLDLIIYLRTSPQVVFDRMKGRGRTEESTVPLEYLSDLHETYEDWLVRKNIVEEKLPDKKIDQRVIVVDADMSKEDVAIQTRQLVQEFLDSYSVSMLSGSDKFETSKPAESMPSPTA